MTTKRLKTFVTALALILCVITTGVFISCGKSNGKKAQLSEFNDLEIKCPVYTEFSFASYLVTLDENGNRYVGTAKVFDENNQPVNVAFNRFEVASMQKYTVIISVKISQEDVRTRKIVVVAKDTSVPVITFLSELYRGKATKEYILPDVKVEKKEGEEISPIISVVLVDGDDIVEQSVTNGRFTPAAGGKYLMIVTATDSDGITVKEEREFYVDEAENSPRDPAREDIY